MLVGLISDTHGLMRPEALEALSGVDVILHAGDVGSASVLDALWAVAPVHAVRGNVDMTGGELRDVLSLQLDGARIHVSHGDELGRPHRLRWRRATTPTSSSSATPTARSSRTSAPRW